MARRAVERAAPGWRRARRRGTSATTCSTGAPRLRGRAGLPAQGARAAAPVRRSDHPRLVYFGSIGLLTRAARARRSRRSALAAGRVAGRAGRAGAAAPGERARRRAGEPPPDADAAAAGPAQARLPRRDPRRLPDVRRHAEHARPPRERGGAARAAGDPLPRQPRPAAPLRPADRLRRRRRGAPARGRGVRPRSALEGVRGAEPSGTRRPGRTGSSCSTAGGSGTRCRACWMGWERKRGKLSEFNRLLLRATRHELYRHERRPGAAARASGS